ncbi:hypothetical protein SMSP2_02473 [Limihaloglobus sulfuriphilus]|uniref:Uncharacterized protein n=1 Tax=Limihaloglobus sulfuriphilus TaxID=1851148 RepID=A0A1R7T605_9BACT|nr:hypothetical protein [Limihaloglobus sulfuriphilus]AQQ72093.1 hypothetical protein SMSP2_02473 [Limihaloglobus sulfuriphilus]
MEITDIEVDDIADSFKAVFYLLTHPGRDKTKSALDELYSYADSVSAQSPAKLKEQNIDIVEKTDHLTDGNVTVSIIAPALARIHKLSHACRADGDSLSLIIAILRYHSNYNYYPDSLSKLIDSGDLNAIPIDPFSNEPFVYINPNFSLRSRNR